MSERNGADGKAVPTLQDASRISGRLRKSQKLKTAAASRRQFRKAAISLPVGPTAAGSSSHRVPHRFAVDAFFVQASGNRSPRIIRFDPAASNMATGPCRYPNVMLSLRGSHWLQLKVETGLAVVGFDLDRGFHRTIGDSD